MAHKDRSKSEDEPEFPLDDKPMLKVKDVASKLNVTERWVQNNATRLGGIKIGKFWRFDIGRLSAKIGELVLRDSGQEHRGEVDHSGRKIRLRQRRRRNPGLDRSQKKAKDPYDIFPV